MPFDLDQQACALYSSLDRVEHRADTDRLHAAHDTISDPEAQAYEYGHVLHAHPRTG
jgi:hypothetical protein